MNTIQVGIIGLGTVGSGVVQVLQENEADIRNRTGCQIRIKTVADRNESNLQAVKGDVIRTKRAEDILTDPEIDIVVEVIGGIQPAKDFILEAFRQGKHVVTANKDLIAVHGHELLAAAKAAHKDFGFEASVAGGIPIIAALKESLAANQFTEILGIINGTTNYILSAMVEQGRDYAEVLAEAQKLGYAEADPASDVEGTDAARKLAILASIAFNSQVSLADVYVEGISQITSDDIRYAKELGCTIKLLAIGKNLAKGIEVRVHPVILPTTHPLASVNGVFNAVYAIGNMVGETMFYGRGAGSLPTGSAIAADIIHISRNIENQAAPIHCTCYAERQILAASEFISSYYIRTSVTDEPRVLASLASIFAEENISFASIIQKTKGDNKAEIVLITHPCLEARLREALRKAEAYNKVQLIHNVIRFESGLQSGSLS
ncbi:MAG: homoserine dehydrogenase [Peptococcaceae bacterium]|jgi:homoserine dehydrogenase|nr:homoserine dehydrogenase [Peptococcaceae bacterium]